MEKASCPLSQYVERCSKVSQGFLSEIEFFRQALATATAAASKQRESGGYSCCSYWASNRDSFHGGSNSICFSWLHFLTIIDLAGIPTGESRLVLFLADSDDDRT
jgi:hypothetical protein